MKCQNCSCQVSSSFKHSFTMNCCPKCGKTLMQENVQDLYLKISKVLEQEDNDIGDVAIWFINHYLPTVKLKSNDITEEISTDSQDDQMPISPKLKKAPSPIKKAQDPSLLSPERAQLFTKRAGIDKTKYDKLVKDIQSGGLTSSTMVDSSDIGDMSDAENYGGSGLSDDTQISDHELQTAISMVDVGQKNAPTSFTEIEKLQKFEQMEMTGSIGKIRRSS